MEKRIGRDINAACNAIAAGGVIAYPTEGVFGLGCDPLNEDAIANLLALKGRDADKGFILLAANRSQLQPFIATPDERLQLKLEQSWPGPVTWILPCSDTAPASVTGNKSNIATRVTDHQIARELCFSANTAVISTSANLSGQPACTTAAQVQSVFGDKLSYILDYEVGNLKGPTPIFDGLTGDQLR